MEIWSLLFSFKGRVKCGPYWLVTIALIAWGAVFRSLIGEFDDNRPMTLQPMLLTLCNFITVLWIFFAVQIKRWHDRDKTGWWALLSFVPIVGQIWIVIECGLLPGTRQDNRFGPS